MEEFVIPADYTFNTGQVRFEPIEKQCRFCNKAQVDNINDCYYVPVFMTKDRTYLVVYSSVKYAKIQIGIPRCKSCRTIHESSGVLAAIIGVVGGIAIFVASISTMSVPLVVIGLFGGAFGGVYGAMYLKTFFISKRGIRNQKEVALENELVKKFLNSGWSLKQPEA